MKSFWYLCHQEFLSSMTLITSFVDASIKRLFLAPGAAPLTKDTDVLVVFDYL